MSYTKLTYHCTFSTKDRISALYDDMRPRLHSYIAGIINKDFGHARKVGGVDDHVHILCDIRPTFTFSNFMSKIKSRSSRWLHVEFPHMANITWQDGYGAFSVSTSVAPKVQRYIENQEEHHKKISFTDEFRELLEKHGIEFDERYLF
jgi:REP element-mobilizing transposase RayT